LTLRQISDRLLPAVPKGGLKPKHRIVNKQFVLRLRLNKVPCRQARTGNIAVVWIL